MLKPKQLIENCHRMIREMDEDKNLRATNDWNYNFMKSMTERYQLGMKITYSMRKTIMDRIENGLKPPVSEELTSKYDKEKHLAEYLSSEQARIFEDIWKQKKKYSKISKKQEDFLASLKSEAKKNMKEGRWEPTKEEIADIKLALDVARCYSTVFWQTHGRSNSRYEACTTFYECVAEGVKDRRWYSKDDFRKFCDVIRTKLEMIKNPKHKLSEFRYASTASGIVTVPGIIVSEPYVRHSGHFSSIVQELLMDGKVMVLPVDNIKKRKPRK